MTPVHITSDLIISFLFANWILVVGLVALLGWYIAFEIQAMRFQPYQITASQLTALLNRDEPVLIDLRPENYFGTGHIAGSMNVPFDTLKDRLDSLKQYQSKPVVLLSGDEGLPRQALPQFKAAGFSDLRILTGGLHQWKAEKLPLIVVKSKSKK